MSDTRKQKSSGRGGAEKKKREILLSDPEPFIRDTLSIKLASRGYDVLAASTGRDTLRMAARLTPALILTEIDYKDVEGFKMCQLLKGNERTGDISIVILTKLDDTPERKFLFNPYADDFLTKPFSPREVARVVDRIIREKGAQR